MDAARKFLALLELAESSELGRKAALEAIIAAAHNAVRDVKGPRAIATLEDLMCLLIDTQSWPDDSAWIDAFQRRLAEVRLGLDFPLNLN